MKAQVEAGAVAMTGGEAPGGTSRPGRGTARLAGPATVATGLALALALGGCGGGRDGSTPFLANLDGTLANCTVEDGATSCSATIQWATEFASPVALQVDGTTISTQASGTASPTVAYGTPITVTLLAGTTTVGPRTVTAVCRPASYWNGTACAPAASSFTLLAFSVADGDTLVSATGALTGTASQGLTAATGTIACADLDDAAATLPVTTTTTFAGGQFTLHPSYQGYAQLPHHARCTLTAQAFNGAVESVTTGPVGFTTDEGPAFSTVLVRAGAKALPSLVDPASGAASSPAAMASNLGQCWGAYERHLGRIRTLCGRTSAGVGAVWDIDPTDATAVAVTSLSSVFSNGNVSEADVVFDHAGTAYMTRGGLQADGTVNSGVVAITSSGHTNIDWDWGGRQDFVKRLLLDEANGRLFAVSQLGFIQSIRLSDLAVTNVVDAGAFVNEALLDDGRIVLAVKTTADGANLLVVDPASGLVSGIPVVGTGRATTGLVLANGVLVIGTSDFSHGVTTGQLCTADPVTFAAVGATPCTATGTLVVTTLASDGLSIFGDLANVLNRWPVTDFTTATPLATFDGAIARAAAVHN